MDGRMPGALLFAACGADPASPVGESS